MSEGRRSNAAVALHFRKRSFHVKTRADPLTSDNPKAGVSRGTAKPFTVSTWKRHLTQLNPGAGGDGSRAFPRGNAASARLEERELG
jgi:hypothetical protein